MESLRSPTESAMPLLLKGEFDRALNGHVTPDAIAAAARAAGLESVELRPRCLIHKYISEPGDIRQLFVVLFDAPEFTRFREQIARMRTDGAAARAGYDPWALSPALFIAASDRGVQPLAAVPGRSGRRLPGAGRRRLTRRRRGPAGRLTSGTVFSYFCLDRND